MYTKQEIIIKSYREGKSQRSISRELQISRRTVKKYISEYESHLQKKHSQPVLLMEYLSQPPIYRTQNRAKFKLTREVQDAIDKLLEENTEKKVLSINLFQRRHIHSRRQKYFMRIR